MRIIGPILRSVDRPWKMYPVGVLFGFGKPIRVRFSTQADDKASILPRRLLCWRSRRSRNGGLTGSRSHMGRLSSYQ